MADVEVVENGGDIEMDNEEEVIETVQPIPADAEDDEEAPSGLENTMPDIPERIGFVE